MITPFGRFRRKKVVLEDSPGEKHILAAIAELKGMVQELKK